MSHDDEASVPPAIPTPASAAPPEGTLSAEDWQAVAYDLTGPDRPMIECDVGRLAALLASLRAALNGLSRSNEGQALDPPRPDEVGTLPVPMTWERTKMVWESLRDLLWLTDRFRSTIWSQQDRLILQYARMRLTGTQFPEALGYYRPVPAEQDEERRVS